MNEKQTVRDSLQLQLVALLVHDLATPLAVTRQFLQRVEQGRYDAVNPKHRKVLESARLAIQRAERILEDVLDQARQGGHGIIAHDASCNLSDIISECVQVVHPLAEDNEVRVDVDLEPALNVPVVLDPNLVARVLDNLLVNAIRHAQPRSVVRVEGRLQDGTIRIEVSNQGREAFEGEIGDIFEPERQMELRRRRQYHGSGLGLTYCRMAMEAMQGSIGAFLREPNEMVFWFQIPIE